MVDGRFVVTFAWAEPPALRIAHQARMIDALRGAAPGLPLPVVVAASTDPALLVTRRSAAVPFFDVRHRITPGDRSTVADDLAAVLVALHDPSLLARVGPVMAAPTPRATNEWADRILATPGRTVLVHGDFHGDNHLWDPAALRLRLVVDLETAGTGEPEFDLRCLPGDGGMELFTATVAAYERRSGIPLDVDRIMAWHVRTVLADARWRTAAGIPLPGHRTLAQCLDDLAARVSGRSGRPGRRGGGPGRT